MNQRLHMRVSFTLLLLLLHLLMVVVVIVPVVNSQASENNPFIWQVVVEYDIARSNHSQKYLPETSFKLYSQDFQTVNPHNDLYGHNDRLLLDFGDGCPQTTIEDIQALNGNTATSPSMMSQPSIALIGRGGRCNYWSDKINHTQALSEVYNLNIGAALVYDNMTYGPGSSTELVQLKTDNGSYPTWPDNGALQPQGRDIRYMADNDIVDNNGSNESGASDSTFMAVYFGPNHYGRVLQDMIHNYTTTPSSSMQQYYVQLTFFFAETTFTTTENEPNNGNGGNGNNDDGRSDMWTVFTGERGYLAYLIAAGAALILGVVLLRWCRNPREADPYPSRSLGDAENGIYLQPTGQGATGERRRKMSLNKLNDMCPVQSLVVGEIQTKNSVCAICLEELEQDDLVRVLPCGHGFCVACIDVWLTKKSCLCPICKYDCDPREEQQDATNEERQQGQPRGSVDLGDPRASETHEAGSPETTAAVTSTNNNNNTTTTAADSSSSHSPSTREVAPSSPSSSTAPASPPPQYRPPSPNTITDNNATTSVLMSTTQSPSTTVNTSSNVVSTPSQLPQ